jgi:hypothetical protein
LAEFPRGVKSGDDQVVPCVGKLLNQSFTLTAAETEDGIRAPPRTLLSLQFKHRRVFLVGGA